MAQLLKLRRSFISSQQSIIFNQVNASAAFRSRARNVAPPKQVKVEGYQKGAYQQPKRGTLEFQKMLQEQKEVKQEIKSKKFFESLTPPFVSVMIFSAAIPHSYLLYPMIWSDACSDAFFEAFELSFGWIATLNALEGAAGCGLGFIDYKTKTGNEPDLLYAMRKKRLAFAKFAFMMAVLGLFLVEKPSPNCVFPLIMASIWNIMKLGTQIGYNLTPDRFFTPRTFLSMYNLVFLIAIWYKLRQARREKLDLEFTFYQRIEGIMLRMSNIFEDQEFGRIEDQQ